MSDNVKPYLKSIYVYNSRAARHFRIDFEPKEDEEFRHLILTGENGSGKTSILHAIDTEFSTNALEYVNEYYWQIYHIENEISELPENDERRKEHENFVNNWRLERKNFDWKIPKVYLGFRDGLSEDQDFIINNNKVFNWYLHFLFKFFPAKRPLEKVKDVLSPAKVDEKKYLLESQLWSHFEQYLVNKRTEQAYAREDGDDKKANEIQKWFDDIEEIFREIFEEENLNFKFVRKRYEFHFEFPTTDDFTDRRTIGFNELADGYLSLLNIFAEIKMKIDALKSINPDVDEPSGIVLIDEIETHLHLELQERILPFLIKIFPKIQFIVATHSPAVIASINNATVYDLTKNKPVDEDLGGFSYDVLMQEHFGLSSEYSLRATKLLNEAKDLLDKDMRNDDEEERLKELCSILERLTPELALDIFLEFERNNRKKTND